MGTSPTTASRPDGRAAVHAFTSVRSWIEGNALQQLEAVAALPGVVAVAGMPDLHPGKYGPVGCAVLSRRIHPQLVGADIGCGMGLFQLDTPVRKLRLDKAAERLRSLEGPWDGDVRPVLDAAGLAPTMYDASLGTVGGGNHFCEVQAIEEIVAPEIAAAAGLDRERAFALVHSGSRGLGYGVLVRHLATGLADLDPASDAGAAYMAAHDEAVRWAVVNRRLIARRAAEALRADSTFVADLAHNLAEPFDGAILHRKGTAAADRGLVPIPGSRGTLSYLVAPLAASRPETLASLAHGAGRKYDRASMHGRVGTTKSELTKLARNPYGGLVVCENRGLLVEEAPDAYKSIDQVIGDLVTHGLARVVATFRPLVTFKTAGRPDRAVESHARRRDKRGFRTREEDGR